MKKQLIRAAASSVLGLSLMTGFAAADINTTGPGSSNRVTTHNTNRFTQTNNNRLHLSNRNDQRASSGDATVRYNTTGGSATSGDASNDNSFDASVSVDNSSGGGGGGGFNWGAVSDPGNIDTTGPGSRNTITTTNSNSVRITNNNNLSVENSNHQSAYTGDATVRYNTTGGDATSGSASNSNSSSFELNVSN
jgi:hypothetical protein